MTHIPIFKAKPGIYSTINTARVPKALPKRGRSDVSPNWHLSLFQFYLNTITVFRIILAKTGNGDKRKLH